MQEELDILQITPKDLRAGKYQSELPELYNLKGVVENSLWHTQQTVFDHSVRVFEELTTALRLQFIKPPQRDRWNKYLNSSVGNKQRRALLKIAALLHDLGKMDVNVKRDDGTVVCPGHELVGAQGVKIFRERFGLTQPEEELVTRLVLYHGFVSEIINYILVSGQKSRYLEIYKKTVGNGARELVLFLYADIKGSDLKANAFQEYEMRRKLLEKIITETAYLK